jgi:FkbM family methyltransferase
VGQARALYSFRDIPDIAASATRQFKKSFQEIWDDRWLQSAAEAGDLWLAEPNVYSAKYEIFTQALADETRHIARHLGLRPSEADILRIATAHSPAAQRLRLQTLNTDTHKGYCEKTLLHPEHLADEPAAKAHGRLKPAEKQLLENEFFEWRKARGYVAAWGTPVIANPTDDALFVPHAGWHKHEPADEVAHYLRQGLYEPDLQAFTWLYVRPGMRVLDIGAHFGLYSRIASIQVGESGFVVALEPNPGSQKLLHANLAALGNVRTLPNALSDSVGSLHLHLEENGHASHSYLSNTEEGVLIETTTLDALVASLQWPAVDFIKIDTEGHEFQVLDGARKVISQNESLVIAVEFSEANLLRTGRTTRQLADLLLNLGMQLCSFNLTELQLERYEGPWPIWYKNLFAVHNLSKANEKLVAATAQSKRVARDIVSRFEACKIMQPAPETGERAKLVQLNKSLEEWAHESEKRWHFEKQRADEATAWAKTAEQRADDAKKLAVTNEKWARSSDTRLERSVKNLADLQAWAKTAEQLLRSERKRADEATAWAKMAEARADDAKKLATLNEKWAISSDAKLAEAQSTIASLEKYLQDHRQWALRCEEEIKALKGQRQSSSP